VTAEMASKIKTRALRCGEAQHDIAAHFHINQGRVSQIVNGILFPEAPFAPFDDID
jgi:predicted XRE-type DNA-binding protein